MTTLVPSSRRAGAIYGLAFGDAWGDPVEFATYAEILRRGRGAGPAMPEKLRITDDTQMSLYLWRAITDAPSLRLPELRMQVAREFVTWLDDPDNNRAPGATCMGALRALKARRSESWPRTWHKATVAESYGCGTVMRAPWIGVHPRLTTGDVAPIAMVQAALTHGHPKAVIAAAATAELTRALALDELALRDAPQWLMDWATRTAEHHVYDRDALGPMHRHARYSRGDYVLEGARAVWKAGRQAELAVYRMHRKLADGHGTEGLWAMDPCTITGEGWDAPTCLSAAVACAALAESLDGGVGPVLALCRAAATGGDSDSIAAVAGALIGAAHGAAAWPADWRGRLEDRYAAELAATPL